MELRTNPMQAKYIFFLSVLIDRLNSILMGAKSRGINYLILEHNFKS